VENLSNHSIIFDVSQQLRAILWAGIEPHAHFGLRNIKDIAFTSPAVRLSGHSSQLSLWLYHVTPTATPRNQPPKRQPAATADAPPLALDLHYLVTPLATDMEKSLHLIEIVLVTFLNQPVITLEDTSSGRQDLSITMRPDTLIDRSQIWQVLRTEHQLSLAYDVAGVQLEHA
jgi:hypothetical protein